jgi:Domain of unknown function (DUF4388)
MSLTGSLHSMDFAELLQWLARGQKTGTLVIASPRVQKQVYFKRGTIIASASSEQTEHLGHFLVSHGFLDEITLAKAVEMQEGNRMLLGKILTTIGAIGEVELEQMLRLKAEESIYEIFTWSDADFQFIEDKLPAFEMVPIALDVQTLVLRGAKRLDDWNRIREQIPSKLCVPVAVSQLVSPEGDAGTERILALVNDDRTIEEIALETHSSEFYVCRILWEQLRLGHMKVVRPRTTETRVEVVSNGDTIDAAALMAAAERHLLEEAPEASLRHMRAASDLDPDSSDIRKRAKEIESKIEKLLVDSGVVPKAVPRLAVSVSDLSTLEISAESGFILSRIDGHYDIGTILKITPIGHLETRVVLWKLLRAGHIYFD